MIRLLYASAIITALIIGSLCVLAPAGRAQLSAVSVRAAEPPAPALTHSISSAPPSPFTGEPFAGKRDASPYPPVEPPPLSLVGDDAEGTLYSRDTNRFYDSADRNDSRSATGQKAANETWLATAFGVKCIDRKNGVVRHYGRAEGLPGTQVIAIACDSSEVWCLVQDPISWVREAKQTVVLHLCSFDARMGRWTGRRSFEIPDRRDAISRGAAISGRSLLAVSSHYVAVVPCFLNATSPAFATLLDRRSDKFTDLPWESGLRADVLAVEPTVLRMDDDSVWVGTDHGLLRWPFKSAEWHRILPGRVIDSEELMNSAKGAAIWVVDRARPRLDGSGNALRAAPGWSLSRIAEADETVQIWSPPSMKVPSSAGDDLSIPAWEDPAVDLGTVAPSSVSVSVDGSIWTTHQGRNAQAASQVTTRGSGWLHFDPATATWKSYVVHGRDSQGYPPRAPSFDIVGSVGAPITFADIPTGAVRSLALISSRLMPNSENRQSGVDEPEVFWLRRRFPEWLCPDASGSGTDGADSKMALKASPPPRPDGRQLLGPIPDPANPGFVWITNESNDVLFHSAPKDVPASLIEMRRIGQYVVRDGRDFTSGLADGVKPYPLFDRSDAGSGRAATTLLAQPDVVGLVPLSRHLPAAADSTKEAGGGSSTGDLEMLVAARDSFYGATAESDTLDPLQTIGHSPYNSRLSPGIAADPTSGGTRVLYVQTNYNLHNIISWEPSTKTFTPLSEISTVDGARDLLGVNPADGGVWLQRDASNSSGPSAVYVPGAARASSTAVERTVVTAPETPRGAWRLLGATSAVAWWGVNPNNFAATEVRGYDGVRKRWIAALPAKIADPLTMDFVRSDARGEIYIAVESVAGTAIWRYDAENDRWIAIADAPPAPPEFPATAPLPTSPVLRPYLIRVTPDAIFLLGYTSRLYRYDRKQARWDAPAVLPERLQNPNDLAERCAASDGDSVYVGGRDALYRLRLDGGNDARLPANAVWQRLQLNVAAPGSGGGSGSASGLRITSLAPGRTSVYALVTSSSPQAVFGARLDVASGRWKLQDETKGFPIKVWPLRLLGDGRDGAWIVGTTGVYRYDDTADRWQQIFVGGSQTEAVSSNPSGASTAPLANIGPSVAFAANGAEVDVLTEAAYAPNGSHNGDPAILWRFATDDGHLLGKLPAPQAGYFDAMFPAGDGTLWVCVNSSFYRVRPDAPADAWHRVMLPEDVLRGSIRTISAGPDGGLWIVSSENAYLWKKLRD